MDHGHGQAHPLAVAFGQLADGPVDDLPDAAGLHDPAQGSLETPAGDIPGGGGEHQQVVDRHFHIQGIELWQVADARAQLGGVIGNVQVIDKDRPISGGQVGGNDP